MKELVFEVRARTSRAKRWIDRLPDVRCLSDSLYDDGDRLWELWHLSGSSDSIEIAERGVRELAPRDPNVGTHLLGRAPRSLQVLAAWGRPEGEGEATIEELLALIARGPGLHRARYADGRLRVRILDPDGGDLDGFYDGLRSRLASAFAFRLVRVGEAGGHVLSPLQGLDSGERRLLESALQEGYYDDPKRCGVREVGESVGLSKSTVARQLRRIERRALRDMLRRSMALDVDTDNSTA